MRQALAAAIIATLCLSIATACGDDTPGTNTLDDPPTDPSVPGSVSSTGPAEGNVGDITGSTPVAAGDNSVIQGNQPMLSSAVD